MFRQRKNNLQYLMPNRNRRIDNNSTILFTNARDETNIAEWIAHHFLLGFDKIIVFDHLSKIPIKKVINTTFGEKLDIIEVIGTGNIKLSLMERAFNYANNGNYSWMLYLDADEYLNLNKFKNVKEFLNNFKEADSIGINWLMFGSSGHIKQPKGLLMDNFIRSDLRLNQHVKTFVRPSAIIGISNPHFYIILNKSRCYSGNGTRMPMGPFNHQPLPFIKSKAYIAHYYIQSEEEHLRRKNRMLDDGSVNKHELIKNIHSEYNTVVNNQLQYKYSQGIKDFLKNNNIEL